MTLDLGTCFWLYCFLTFCPHFQSRMARRKPYTQIGIRRLKCFRCGQRAEHQWQICADDRVFRPICVECDIELNKLVLEWMGFPDAAEKIDRYKARYVHT